MKTLTLSEAARDLATWFKQALAGEEIIIRSDGSTVALRPVPTEVDLKSISPREALRRLQQETLVTPAQAENYLREVRADRPDQVFHPGS